MVAYLRLSPRQKMDPRVINLLPEYFNGAEIQYDKAVERVLRKSFPKWFKGETDDGDE